MNDLINDLYLLLIKYNVPNEAKQDLVILLSDYEIIKKKTEIIPYTSQYYNQQILMKFILNKQVSGATERTLKYYKTTLDFILNRIEKVITDIKSDDLKLYIAYRQVRDNVSATTICNEWRVMSTFFKWLEVEEIIDKNPMHKVEKPKIRKLKKEALTQMQCELLRDAADNLRDKAIIDMLLSTWCRVSELCGMNRDDLKDNVIKVLGKGKKERNVYLDTKAMLSLRKYLDSRDDDNNAMFVSLDRPHERLKFSGVEIIIRNYGKKLGIENVHPHRFRRTGATMALRKGMPIEEVSHLLGHEQLDTTQIYLDLNEDDIIQAHKKYVN